MSRSLDFRALGLGLAFATIWSSAFTSSRIVVEYWPPFLVLSARFLCSGLIALGIGFAAGQRIRLSAGEWRAVVVFGVCQNALYLGLFHLAMRTIEASLAAIIASAMPLCVAALGRVFLGQRLAPIALAGLLAGFAGVLVIMTGRLGPRPGLGRGGRLRHRRAGARGRHADAQQRRRQREPLDRRRAADAGRVDRRSSP